MNLIPVDAVVEVAISKDEINTRKASISNSGIEAFFINKNLKKLGEFCYFVWPSVIYNPGQLQFKARLL